MFKGFSSLIESMFLLIFTYIDPIKIYHSIRRIWVMILLIERNLHQLRLVVYPINLQGFSLFRIFSINSSACCNTMTPSLITYEPRLPNFQVSRRTKFTLQ